MNFQSVIIETGTKGVCGITLDEHSNIYFTTRDKQLWMTNLKKFTPPKRIISSDTFLRGIVWDPNDILYICDWNNHVIIKYFLHTGKTTFLGTGHNESQDGPLDRASFCFPTGIAKDQYMNLYIAELRTIRKIDTFNKTVETVAGNCSKGGYLDGPAQSALFDGPTGVTISDDGTLYVSDCGNHCIRKIKDGMVSTLFQKGQLTYPTGITQYNGILIASDVNTIWKTRPDTKYQCKRKVFTERGIACVATDHEGNMLVGVNGNIIKLLSSWKMERLLWIAKLKENSSYCPMSLLPKDIIYEICSLMVQ